MRKAKKQILKTFENSWVDSSNHALFYYDDIFVVVTLYPSNTIILVEVCMLDDCQDVLPYSIREIENILNRRFKNKVVVDFNRVMIQDIVYGKFNIDSVKFNVQEMAKRAKSYKLKLVKNDATE
ncbi:hypothetical protein D6777_03965 [Candidatus Woesearchaeota archaeon]|nr:MAG: hypothetical protein D6777_03965 [Candidatus Woesearchaeota archaeon]